MLKRKTRSVSVGKLQIGSEHPIRIQSMTTSDSRDVEATVSQIIRLADAGCELVRLTVQGIKEAEGCEKIKESLLRQGYEIPLAADIHFFPAAALRAADFIEKIRINPGNYSDRRATFKTILYDDLSYATEIEKIEERFAPLVQKCKQLHRAMRIGTNHGSLSDRILNRYGNTPLGMVESALEFAQICRKYEYHNFLFSMKSSNPLVMMEAYRLLVARMDAMNWDYPLHLGVTEAGAGQEGRVKSAIGIGALLLEGIGDTIRISLTEDPWHEVDPCRRLIEFVNSSPLSLPSTSSRQIRFPEGISLHRDGSVCVGISSDAPDLFEQIGCKPGPQLTKSTADLVHLGGNSNPVLEKLGITTLAASLPLVSLTQIAQAPLPFALQISDEDPSEWEKLLSYSPALLCFSPHKDRIEKTRKFFDWLCQHQCTQPLLLRFSYTCSTEDLPIQAAAECGTLLCNGIGEGLWLEGPYSTSSLRILSFQILQACRKRSFQTDFISCPGCGRTLFNLQEVTKEIQARTSHLPGVKIAIMGCIVNGPGEMADADFGYVGSKPGKIDLYVGKQCVEKDIESSVAADRLIALIQAHGRWVPA